VVAAHQQEARGAAEVGFGRGQRGGVPGLPVGGVDDLDVAAGQPGRVADLIALVADHHDHAIDAGVANGADGAFDERDAAEREEGLGAPLGDAGEPFRAARSQHDTDLRAGLVPTFRSRRSGVGQRLDGCPLLGSSRE
jgi:hypothetical protein